MEGSDYMNKALLESLKELLRVVLIAVLPVLYTSLDQGTVDWKAVGIVAVVAGLRAVDKWLHESGVADKGLTRF